MTDFTDSEGLRSLLFRLYGSGPDAWRDNPEVTELMVHTMEKYGALARRHGMDPADAAAAAFEVLRTRPVRKGEDPWAVVTHAVQISIIAEDRARGMLCSTTRARRPEMAGFHDAERLSDRETSLADYHPAFQSAPDDDKVAVLVDAFREKKERERKERRQKELGADPEPDVQEAKEPLDDEPTNAFFALDMIVEVLTGFGWPEATARPAVEYIGSQLSEAGSRGAAYERLRRDRQPWMRFDLDMEVWGTLLRAVLGSPDPDRQHTAAGQGMWKRFVQGYDVEQILADRSLVGALATSARHVRRRRSHV